MTNFERIKNMTVEEMAEFLSKIVSRDIDIVNKCKYNDCNYRNCDSCTIEWLNSESEE